MRPIVFSNPISKYFTYIDALWLPKWHRPANESDGLNDEILDRLIGLFERLDQVFELFNGEHKFRMHVAYRPEIYNRTIHGAPDSAHMALRETEAAVDFDVTDRFCPEVQKCILESDLLTHLDMRMENNGENATWIHLDTRKILPGHNRFFIP